MPLDRDDVAREQAEDEAADVENAEDANVSVVSGKDGSEIAGER